MKVAALAGGIGGSKLLVGLYRKMDPGDLTVIVNTGDDIELHGLYISPDLDTVAYTLANAVNSHTGWGIRDDTFHCFQQLKEYGHQNWFNLGDRDLATHIHRTAMLRGGASLSQVTDSIRIALGVRCRILPMSDDPVPTIIDTDCGRLHFQEYLVQNHSQPVVQEIIFSGVESARPAPGVIAALEQADAIVICPSNPLISIGPILAVSPIRNVLRRRRDSVLAVCPLVGGKSLKGPSDQMLRQLGFDVSAAGVARIYKDICSTFLLDPADADNRGSIEALGVRVAVSPTVMHTTEDKERVAQRVLELFAARVAAA